MNNPLSKITETRSTRVLESAGISLLFFLKRFFFEYISNEKEVRKDYNPERGIILFVYKYRCKYLFRMCVKLTGDDSVLVSSLDFDLLSTDYNSYTLASRVFLMQANVNIS